MTDVARIETLIQKVALHEREALSELYSATSAKLFGVVLRVLDNRAEAEDALQEIYVKIWNRADRYRVTGHSPMTWLITVARNHAIDRLRARPATAATLDEEMQVADSAPSPEASAIAASEARRIAACMGELPEDRAGAVRGAYLEGETYEELARRFDVPLNTMRTWLRRSLLALKECLAR